MRETAPGGFPANGSAIDDGAAITTAGATVRAAAAMATVGCAATAAVMADTTVAAVRAVATAVDTGIAATDATTGATAVVTGTTGITVAATAMPAIVTGAAGATMTVNGSGHPGAWLGKVFRNAFDGQGPPTVVRSRSVAISHTCYLPLYRVYAFREFPGRLFLRPSYRNEITNPFK